MRSSEDGCRDLPRKRKRKRKKKVQAKDSVNVESEELVGAYVVEEVWSKHYKK